MPIFDFFLKSPTRTDDGLADDLFFPSRQADRLVPSSSGQRRLGGKFDSPANRLNSSAYRPSRAANSHKRSGRDAFALASKPKHRAPLSTGHDAQRAPSHSPADRSPSIASRPSFSSGFTPQKNPAPDPPPPFRVLAPP